MRAALLALLVVLSAAPAAAQCSVAFPPLTADQQAAAVGGGFLDATYVANLPAPCVAHALQIGSTPPTWTVSFPADATAATYQLQIFVATAGYWQSDVPAAAAPAVVLNVGKPAADATGTVTIPIAPALTLGTTYRLAVVSVHADGSMSAPSACTDPFDVMPCGCASPGLVPATPIILRVGGAL